MSKFHADTFIKLFNTKQASCDWRYFDRSIEHLKFIVLKQYNNGEVPCIDPFSLFMLNFTMQDKLVISMKWAEAEKKKAFN